MYNILKGGEIMKVDELQFLKIIYDAQIKILGRKKIFDRFWVDIKETPREVINRDSFIMPHKRAWYLLQKWASKGWYDYGTTLDLGWLTDEGKREIEILIKNK